MKGVSRKGTGVVYDMKMLEHHCLWDPEYPEKPERLSAVINRSVIGFIIHLFLVCLLIHLQMPRAWPYRQMRSHSSSLRPER